MTVSRQWLILALAVVFVPFGVLGQPAAGDGACTVSVDPLTRYIHVRYPVPADAPDEVVIACAWSTDGGGAWQPARVFPLVSETAMELVPAETWNQGVLEGRITERRAAGLERTVIFNPYPEAQQEGRVDVRFRIDILSPDGAALARHECAIEADNSDVMYVEDWSRVLQQHAFAAADQDGVSGPFWNWHTGLGDETHTSLGNALHGEGGNPHPLPQLSYPLDLKGTYAVFVCTPASGGGVRLRFTGDERTDMLASRHAFEEVFWRWNRMDRQDLVVRQPHAYTGWVAADIDYVKLVPLGDELAAELNARYGGEVDKLVAGYWEPYSWAFHEDVHDPLQHREPLTAFAEARIGLVDTQIGRFGMKVVYESRLTDRLLYATQGDPIGHIERPQTDNVGRMQQFTNTLDATLRYGRDLGLNVHANFGASNCYPGSPLQGDLSKEHPEWMRGSCLRFEVPEVRHYVMALFREALEIGAPGISIDFCRYPETIDTVETGNATMSELHALASEFGEKRGAPVPVLVRFPGTGVRRAELFDYATWAAEGWVDYLCPSNIQGRHMHIGMAPYQAAVAGTKCMLLPSLEGLGWGLPLPGPFLWRAAQVYAAGIGGVHVYQADGRILGRPGERRCMRMLASSAAVRQFWEEDAALRPRASKGIYINTPERVYGWEGYQRLRVWTEGVPMGAMELYLDGALVNRCDGPPYMFGNESYESDGVVPPGEHALRVRVQDGNGWLEQTFPIRGAG